MQISKLAQGLQLTLRNNSGRVQAIGQGTKAVMTQSIISQFFSFLNPAATTSTGNGKTASLTGSATLNGAEQNFSDLLKKLGIAEVGANGIYADSPNSESALSNGNQSVSGQTLTGILLNTSSFNTPSLQTNLQSLSSAPVVDSATAAPAQKLLALLQVIGANAINNEQLTNSVVGQSAEQLANNSTSQKIGHSLETTSLPSAVLNDIKSIATLLGVEPETVLSTLQSLAGQLGISAIAGQSFTQQSSDSLNASAQTPDQTDDPQILSSIAAILLPFIPQQETLLGSGIGTSANANPTISLIGAESGSIGAQQQTPDSLANLLGTTQSAAEKAATPLIPSTDGRGATSSHQAASTENSGAIPTVAPEQTDITAQNATQKLSDPTLAAATNRETAAQSTQNTVQSAAATQTQVNAQTAVVQPPHKQSAQVQSRAAEDAAIDKAIQKTPSQQAGQQSSTAGSGGSAQPSAQNKSATNTAISTSNGDSNTKPAPTLADSLMQTLGITGDVSTDSLDGNEIPGITQTGTNSSSLTSSAHISAPQRSAALPYAAYVTSQVAVQIGRAVDAGSNSFNIRLDPAELGRVDVKLDIGHDGRVNAVIGVDNEKTLQLLQREHGSLERALQDAGLKTDSGSLNFSLNHNNDGSQTADQGKDNGTRPSAGPLNEQDKTIANAVRMTISDRALDIRV